AAKSDRFGPPANRFPRHLPSRRRHLADCLEFHHLAATRRLRTEPRERCLPPQAQPRPCCGLAKGKEVGAAMTGPKVVLVVLVLTAVLYAVGVGLGVGRNEPGKVDLQQLRQNALVKAIEEMFIKKEKLDVAHLTIDCRREGNAVIIDQGK